MVGAPGLEPEIGRLKVCCDTVSPHPRYLITLVTCHDRSPFKKIKIARDLARQGRVWLCLVPPERFELPAPAFVAQCSNPNELRWCVEFESSSITVIATIDPCNKAGREGDTPLGILNTQIDNLVVYGITPPVLYTRLTFEESS